MIDRATTTSGCRRSFPLLLDHARPRDNQLAAETFMIAHFRFLVVDYATCLTDIKNKTPGEIAGR
ncbi:hypothetical protein [Bradyrhizobium sp. HKCCYLS20291]|uniref:hypothetical protein n=1 Tax=Bradyrhizobium sp. HKCCYLS20291 TaxID=3420766 RepID=UPI003EC05AA2